MVWLKFTRANTGEDLWIRADAITAVAQSPKKGDEERCRIFTHSTSNSFAVVVSAEQAVKAIGASMEQMNLRRHLAGQEPQ
jgi:hypothetical protein